MDTQSTIFLHCDFFLSARQCSAEEARGHSGTDRVGRVQAETAQFLRSRNRPAHTGKCGARDLVSYFFKTWMLSHSLDYICTYI